MIIFIIIITYYHYRLSLILYIVIITIIVLLLLYYVDMTSSCNICGSEKSRLYISCGSSNCCRRVAVSEFTWSWCTWSPPWYPR